MELAKELDKEMAKSIGIKLMLARDNAELTRDELSEKADVEANSIYRYETGKQVLFSILFTPKIILLTSNSIRLRNQIK